MKMIISKSRIDVRVNSLANELLDKLNGSIEVPSRPPIFVCVLSGAMPFFVDLIRAYKGDLEVQSVKCSSYLGQTSRQQDVKIEYIGDWNKHIRDRDVVIVEDIVDTGHTISALHKDLMQQAPKSITVVAAVLKVGVDTPINVFEYVWRTCFTVQKDTFTVGYGMDVDGLYRNLTSIYDKNSQ